MKSLSGKGGCDVLRTWARYTVLGVRSYGARRSVLGVRFGVLEMWGIYVPKIAPNSTYH